jgi:hypothetical protein
MSRVVELDFLKAQLAQVSRMLEQIGDRRSLKRPGLEHRESELRAEIARLGAAANDRAAGVVTFSGEPVVGSKGIRAKFAAQALRLLESAIVAATLPAGAAVAARGKVARQDDHRLFVTAIAHGSFGFQLEEIKSRPADGQMELPGPSALVFAMEQVVSLLQAASGEDEDAFALAVAGSNPRVQSSLSAFGKVLARERAGCKFGTGTRRTELSSPEQLERLHTRLATQHIVHEECTLSGKLFTLPQAHQFELVIASETFSGRIDPTVPQEMLARHANSDVTIQATKTTVASSAGTKVKLLMKHLTPLAADTGTS